MSRTDLWVTERLRFRPFTGADYEQLRLLDTDPNVVRYLGSGRVRDEAESRLTLARILGHYAEQGFSLYATELKDTGEFVGRTGLIPWTLDGDSFWEVGYTFRPQFWGQGFATEAAQFWKSFGFRRFPIDFLVSLIHPQNGRSIHVAEKVGMRFWRNTQVDGNPVRAFRIDRPVEIQHNPALP
jgi:RimJ/RimL family protein N-acetyltransferase